MRRTERRYVWDLEYRHGVCSIGGGDSSSSSSSATTTTNVDKRAAVGDQSLLVTSDSSTVNVQVLDAGAIQKAVDIAKLGIDADKLGSAQNAQAFKDVLDLTNQLFGRAFDLVDKNRSFAEAGLTFVSKAYENAKDPQNNNPNPDAKSMLLLAGLAIGGVALIARRH